MEELLSPRLTFGGYLKLTRGSPQCTEHKPSGQKNRGSQCFVVFILDLLHFLCMIAAPPTPKLPEFELELKEFIKIQKVLETMEQHLIVSRDGDTGRFMAWDDLYQYLIYQRPTKQWAETPSPDYTNSSSKPCLWCQFTECHYWESPFQIMWALGYNMQFKSEQYSWDTEVTQQLKITLFPYCVYSFVFKCV